MKQLVLATSNAGKLAELKPLLAEFDYALVTQGELGVSDAIEDGRSFIENAIIKARHASAATGLPALADDSGLVVPALGGEPGIHSARYAGTHGDSAANIAKLLDAMRSLPDSQRAAHFTCVLVLLRHADDPEPLVAEGRWFGQVLLSPRGGKGFGYDPVFLDPRHGLTAAELDAATKNQASHRGQAIARLRALLARA
ncbi:MAG TPA: RdgB/HAM1 family non-canonical purine NTP pyrophosphatase [Arenimonas sp.]